VSKQIHPKAAALKLHRLSRPGKGLLGPEFAGCFNTGKRPRILRVRAGYVVGAELDVSDLAREVTLSAMLGRPLPTRLPKKDARFYKTATAARKRFRQRISDVLYYNDAARAEVARLRCEVDHPNPLRAQEAAAKLYYDHGVTP